MDKTEVMNQVMALKLASQAIDYMLNDTLELDAFDINEIELASNLLSEQRRVHKGQKKHPDQPILDTARTALIRVWWILKGHRRNRRKSTRLSTAADALPNIIDRVEREYNDYWQAFTEEALIEAEQIIELA